MLRWEYWTAEGGPSAAFLDSVAWGGGHPVDTYTTVNVTGPATADFTGGWLTDSSNMVVHLTPSVNYYKITLSGDTEGVTLTDTVLTFEVTQARTINVLVEELTLEDALDSTGIRWRTGGNAVWFPETATTRPPEPRQPPAARTRSGSALAPASIRRMRWTRSGR